MSSDFALLLNPQRASGAPYDPLRRFVSRDRAREAGAEIRTWPGYNPTPLLNWPELAQATGVSSILCKYEGARFGVGSFKALGGAYAAMRAVQSRAAAQGLSPDAITVTTASDGNHGLSVAWGARRVGARAVIFLHANVSTYRQQLIESMGAEVVRVAGNYDDSTATAAARAAEEGWILVADTATTYSEHPLRVMAGYGVITEELSAQIPPDEAPTHIFLQGGCGGFAAALCGLWREADNSSTAPLIIVVEPDKAACLFESCRAGQPVLVGGDLDTIMSGLSVGEVSALAWPVLRHGADAFMTITDAMAIAAMQMVQAGTFDTPVEIGDSGIAGLAGFLAVNADPATRATLRLTPESRILLIATEGPVDRESYDRLIASPVAAGLPPVARRPV